jgi:hypothetical protein
VPLVELKEIGVEDAATKTRTRTVYLRDSHEVSVILSPERTIVIIRTRITRTETILGSRLVLPMLMALQQRSKAIPIIRMVVRTAIGTRIGTETEIETKIEAHVRKEMGKMRELMSSLRLVQILKHHSLRTRRIPR